MTTPKRKKKLAKLHKEVWWAFKLYDGLYRSVFDFTPYLFESKACATAWLKDNKMPAWKIVEIVLTERRAR